MSNPFNFGNPAPPHRMVGRSDMLEAIISDLINYGGHSHIVIGGRRFGKSSFLESLQYFLAKRIDQAVRGDWYVFPVVINLQRLIKDTPEGVFGLMVNALHRGFDPLYSQKALGMHFDLELEKTKLQLFVRSKQKECSLDDFCEITDELLEVFNNAYGLLRLIFLVDEIEVGLDKDWTERLFSQLRSLIYEGLLRNYIRYVIVGSSQVIDVREKGSPLLNMLKTNYLRALDEKNILEIINWANDVPPDVAASVVKQCGGHPFIAQYLMHYLWEAGISLTTASLVKGLASKFIHERNADLKNWILSIGKAGQLVYKLLAETDEWLTEAEVSWALNNPELNIQPALVTLCYHGLVIHDGTWNKYHAVGELFRDWFTDNVLPSLPLSDPAAQLSLNFLNDSLAADILLKSSAFLHVGKSYRSRNMPGIPHTLYNRLHKTLLECGPFDSDQQLRAVFANDLLVPWRYQLPQTSSLTDRVDTVISFLMDKRRAEIQTSALVLLLTVLRDRTDPKDDCYARLDSLTEDLGAALQVSPYYSSSSVGSEEANPENQHMIFTVEWMRLLENVGAVGQVNVPKILRGQMTQHFPSGTGWLVAPGLALTCWHVIKARGPFDGGISDADLEAQVANSVLTFDYTLPGQGVEYRVIRLECYDADLDYVLLCLEDRPDHPLSKRGVLNLDVSGPLTLQTTLYVIQHPKGQPQQNSAGRFVKYKIGQSHRILHSAPTEIGTSGAPVMNVTNWGVVALHNGENNDEHLREATLLRAILPDIQQKRPDLYSNIIDAH